MGKQDILPDRYFDRGYAAFLLGAPYNKPPETAPKQLQDCWQRGWKYTMKQELSENRD